ncbi:MAG: BlaI/MecI/CopY family transcriptional regulator [Paramuribaculum sp.]|nr:BlaI/MecI/CopY family transcriptional regulator [Paramuribaculum sp.]
MRSNNIQQPQLTAKEMVLMKMLWNNGPMFVREMLALYPEPKPHFNTVSTIVRILEEKGHVAHEVVGSSHRYYAVSKKEDFSRRTLARVVSDYFNNSYKSVVSALVKEEKISVDELREIIDIIDRGDSQTGS